MAGLCGRKFYRLFTGLTVFLRSQIFFFGSDWFGRVRMLTADQLSVTSDQGDSIRSGVLYCAPI
jgi:hypothetical protein